MAPQCFGVSAPSQVNGTWHSRVGTQSARTFKAKVCRGSSAVDRYAWLPCLHTQSRHHNLASPADSKGSICITDAICWVRPVSEGRVGLSLASVLQVDQLAWPLFWTRYIDKFSGCPCSTGVVHCGSRSYWCLRELLDPLRATVRCNAITVNI